MQMSRYLRKIYLCIYAVTRIHLILYQIYDILYEEKIDRIKNLLILLFVVMSTWKLFSKKKNCVQDVTLSKQGSVVSGEDFANYFLPKNWLNLHMFIKKMTK
jgi:hypothetical protein